MQYRRLGGAGLRISALSFGAWVTLGDQVDEDVALACLIRAREHGVNFFDNAEAYAAGKAEEVMGRLIRKAGWKRSDLIISTKMFWGGSGPNDQGLSRKHLIEGTLASLDRLGMEYVDLLFCHRPDPETPIEESVRAMAWLVDQGKAFYWGTSHWTAEQIREAYAVARREHLVPPTMEQPQYNMFVRDKVEREFARLYRDIGLGLTVWSPLASGLLTGKYNDGIPEGSRLSLEGYGMLRDRLESGEGRERIAKVRRLAPIATELGATLAQLAIAWTLLNPHVSTTITGASRPEQVDENMAALDLLPALTPDVVQRIEAVLGNRPEGEKDYRE